MNSKILILVVVVVVVFGGYFLLNQSKTQTSQEQPKTQSTAQPTTQETTVQGSTVMVTSSGFDPQVLTIKAGTKVIWTNKSGGSVTVNSAVHPTHLLYPFLNLGEFNDGSSVSVVVEKPGTYTYHNHLNPSQTGKIIAQ